MKYTGAERMPLTLPKISDTCANPTLPKGIFLNFKQLCHYNF